MCFDVKPKSRAKITKTDTECWKVICKNNTPTYPWVHECYNPYIINETCPLVELRKKPKLVGGGHKIEEGYHSYKTNDPERLIDDVVWKSGKLDYEDALKVCKFIIPAGTRYYENDTEYVSETIMLVE